MNIARNNFAIASLALVLTLIVICIAWFNKCKQAKVMRQSAPKARWKNITKDKGNMIFLEELVANRSST